MEIKPPDGCYQYSQTPEGFYTCDSVTTALGNVPTLTPTQFINTLFTWLLGLAGFLMVALTIYAGYLYLTSSGDKEKVSHAREILTAAASGLVFIIFSTFILELIGVEILGIFRR